MSFLKTIQLFVANNPGLTNKEIAAALPEYALHSVQRAVCRLVMLNRAERKGVRPNFRYYAKAPVGPIGPIVPRYPVEKAEVMPEPKQESAPNPAVVAMMEKAKELFDKGLFLRAATVLMDAFNRSKSEEMREKIMEERQRCLNMVQRAKPSGDGWCLAGRARNV
ncbi:MULTISPECIES: hypothetical protein [Enterobacter cloacae complex]|uniref:hypothetical protein n=1 Tax=Enterobacter cloacae complex TaxID=354276 RepID=UPI00075E10DB|nr:MULTISPECIES: hypothetical protein [Enterobacter cloacae complex]ELT0931623.1 hypothetical protein [Enterobacter roggenkampii]KVJ92038.1 hypothetical protein AWS24_12490 [Enterobacter asburiae]MBL5937781.1 hypothetical protein [Enterobacter asburiae]MDS0028093.1 hypothetical protein [Enterobacter cloacae subsp. cloacae]